MSDTVKDLDALVPSPKQVRLDGVTYAVPGDLPMEIFVKINLAGEQEKESQVTAIETMVEALVDLFSIQYIDTPGYEDTRAKLDKSLRKQGTAFLYTLVRNVYSADETPAEEADQATPPAAG